MFSISYNFFGKAIEYFKFVANEVCFQYHIAMTKRANRKRPVKVKPKEITPIQKKSQLEIVVKSLGMQMSMPLSKAI